MYTYVFNIYIYIYVCINTYTVYIYVYIHIPLPQPMLPKNMLDFLFIYITKMCRKSCWALGLVKFLSLPRRAQGSFSSDEHE